MKYRWIRPVFLLMLLESTEQQFPCDPAVDCAGLEAGNNVPDPNDCESYYTCINLNENLVPTTTSFSCTNGEYFDLTTRDCQVENIPGICNSNPCSCISECLDLGPPSRVADKFSCSHYYLCDGASHSVYADCPAQDPYFNGQDCVADSSQCCNFCQPSCPGPFLQIQDPCDCTASYFCDESAMISVRFPCDSGKYFDESTGKCEVGQCTSICSSCGSSYSTATNTPDDTTTNSLDTTTNTPDDTTTNSLDTTTNTQDDTTTNSLDTTTNTPDDTTTNTPYDTTTTPDNCPDTFNCPSNWDYPRCPYCDRSYWHCNGGVATKTYCIETQLFNTDLSYPYCIPSASCPYHAPFNYFLM